MSKRRVIKKYFNRRLYDTEKSRYITLEELRDMYWKAPIFACWRPKPMMTSRPNLVACFVVGGNVRRTVFFGTKLAQFDYVYARPDERANVGIF